jgi:site-specific DNA recombinase
MRTKRITKQQKTAVIYARARGASLDEENQAIQAQLRECREWAEKRGYSVAKAYIDQGKGAYRNLEQREGLKELVADALRKPQSFDAVIYYSPDRLFRDIFELETFRATLGRKHVELISVTDAMAVIYARLSSSESKYRDTRSRRSSRHAESRRKKMAIR